MVGHEGGEIAFHPPAPVGGHHEEIAMSGRKRYRISRAGWTTHARRSARGLHKVAAHLVNTSSQETLQAALATVPAADHPELAAMLGEYERDERAIERGLRDEDPGEAAAAGHRARTWREVRRRLPSARRRAQSQVRATARAPRLSASARGARGTSSGSDRQPTPCDPQRGRPVAGPPTATADGLSARLSLAYGKTVTPDEAREIARTLNEFASLLAGWAGSSP